MNAVADLDDPRIGDYRLVADLGALAERGLFVVEGRLVVPRLLAASASPGRWAGSAQSLLLSPAAFEQMRAALVPHADVPVFVVPQAVMNEVVGFNIHRGCLAMARRPAKVELTDHDITSVRRAVILEGVNNPDNIGGIFRSAAALGADLLVQGPGGGDPLYRKAVRTSMGAVFDVPFVHATEWPGALGRLRDAGFTIAALTPATDATPLGAAGIDTNTRIALLAGAEGSGLSAEAMAWADRRVTIPMTGRVDSLNVATSVAIALYHVGMDRPS